MIKRKFIKSLLVVFFVSLLSLSIGIAITKAKTTIRDIVFEDANYAGTYSIGDSITIGSDEVSTFLLFLCIFPRILSSCIPALLLICYHQEEMKEACYV